MKYVSTRGSIAEQSFEDVLLSGLARDGGLFVPEAWPNVTPDDIRALAPLRYTEIVTRIVRPFIEVELVSDSDLTRIVEQAYSGFRHSEIAPLQQLDEDTWVLELFHGPTLAFKDFALQLLGGAVRPRAWHARRASYDCWRDVRGYGFSGDRGLP